MPENEDALANVVAGTVLGALVGSGLGLGACICFFDEPPFFTGDTILVGGVACGSLGYFLGESFIDWLKENWWWFW